MYAGTLLCQFTNVLWGKNSHYKMEGSRIRTRWWLGRETVMPGDVGMMFKGALPRVLLKLAGLEGPLEQS